MADGTVLNTKFEQIVDLGAIGNKNPKKMTDLLTLASSEQLLPSSEDKKRVLFIGIDFQNDFMERGELSVPHSHRDIENVTMFIYNNMQKITDIKISLDTHSLQQIFHPSWWIDKSGHHPAPYTIITAQDVKEGRWMAVENQKESLEYVQKLETLGKKQLCIWTYHCIEGTYGAALEGQFSNIIHFHSIARKSKIEKIVKGKDPLSEMYGIIKPEYDKYNYCNNEFLTSLQSYDKIFVAGEAKSHCVVESVRQILEHYEDDKEMTQKIFLLEDCMSSIQGFEGATEEAFENFKTKYGVSIVTSTDVHLD